MNERLKDLRKALNLTQQEFADRIGIKRNSFANYETGRNTPIDAIIKSICREFKVNEEWLRTGEGDMFKPVNKNLQILEYFNDVAEMEDSSFKKRISLALAQLSDEGWQHLEQFLDEFDKNSN
nr:MAG TPA: Repressor protein CI [Caudoviricetes sp.]